MATLPGCARAVSSLTQRCNRRPEQQILEKGIRGTHARLVIPRYKDGESAGSATEKLHRLSVSDKNKLLYQQAGINFNNIPNAQVDRYVTNKVSKMARPEHPKDIEVEITFLTFEEGGKKSPVFSGYRPQCYYDGHDWDAIHNYVGVEEPVYPGQTVVAHLSFLRPQYHTGHLYPGKEFLIREGQRVVARGRVTKLLELEKSAKAAKEREAKQSGTPYQAT